MKKSEEATVIIEEATTKIKTLCAMAFSIVSFIIIKQQVNDIIKKASKEIKELGYSDLAKDCKISLMSLYLGLKANIIKGFKENEFTKSIVPLLTTSNPNKKVNAITLNDEGKKIEIATDAEHLRQMLTKIDTGYGQMIIDDYKKKVADMIVEIGNTRPTLKDSLGRTMSLRNLSEMTVRYEQRQEDFKNLGDAKYVIASQHANASFRCEPFQGKIYLMDIDPNEKIKPKVIKGYIPKPIGKYDGRDYYSLKEAMEHGFLSYNCRHRLTKYLEGMDIPKPIPASVVNKERKIETNMRAMEREIRHYKEMQSLDKENRQEWVNKSKKMQVIYEDYAKKNNMAREKWRTSISRNERQMRLI